MKINLRNLFLTCICVFCSFSNAYSQQLFEIKNQYLTVEASDIGAELMSIRTKDREYLWQGRAEFWKNRAPVMFPVNVRYRNNEFTYKGKTYQMPFMGIAMNAKMTGMVNAGQTQMSFKLVSNDSILTHHYPFPFELTIRYTLKEKSLIMNLELHNVGKETMYYAIGVHPGFQLSLSDTVGRKDYEVRFSDKPVSLIRKRVNNGLLLHETEKFIENECAVTLDDKRIANTGMFFENALTPKIGIGRKGELPFMYIQKGNFPNINFWSPPGFPFACIETMAGHHDFVDSPTEISEKKQLLTLLPGKSKSYYITMIFP